MQEKYKISIKMQKCQIRWKKCADLSGFPHSIHTVHAPSKFLFNYIPHLLSVQDQLHFARQMSTLFFF
jgi:hypothetical protein